MDTATKFWRAAAKITLCFLIIAMLTIALFPALFAQAQTVEVGVPVEERANLFPTRSMPARGEGKMAVFLIDFPDYRNQNSVATREYYDKLYFSGIGIWTDYGEISVKNFACSYAVPVAGLDLHLRDAQIVVRLRQAVAGGARPRRMEMGSSLRIKISRPQWGRDIFGIYYTF